MKGRDFEKGIEAWLKQQGWAVHRALPNSGRRGPFWYTNSNDILGCIDLVAVHADQGLWFIQAGTTGHVSQKRKEVAALPWPKTLLDTVNGLRVSVFEARERPDDTNPRRKVHLARIHDLQPDGSWGKPKETVTIA